MAAISAGWERIVLPWDQIQPSGAGDFSNLGITIGSGQLQHELNRGVTVVGLLEFTPAWAARSMPCLVLAWAATGQPASFAVSTISFSSSSE